MVASQITACKVGKPIARPITKSECPCNCDDDGGGGPEPEVYVDFFDEFFSVDDPWDNFYVQFYVTSGTRPEAEVT
jgi:hypothetical protein